MRGHRGGGKGRGGRGGGGGMGQLSPQHQRQQQDGNRRRSRAPDTAEFERQLTLQRQRQERAVGRGEGAPARSPEQQPQQHQDARRHAVSPSPSPPPPPPPPALPGFEYDAARGRYFPAARRARSSPTTSSSPRPPAVAHAAATAPPSPRCTFLHNNIAGRIREREWCRGQRLRMGAIDGLLHIDQKQEVVGRAEALQDIDMVDTLIVTGGRNGMVKLFHTSPTAGHTYELMNCGSAVAAVRWRWTGMSREQPTVLAVAEMGSNISRGVGGSAVTVCKFCDGADPFSLQVDRFSLGKRDVWGVEWDPLQGRRLLPGLSTGPLLLLDTEAGRQLSHPFHLPSDCFASCWGQPDSNMNDTVFLGLRNGQVQLVDLRAPTTHPTPLTRMGCVVDQVQVLAQGRGMLVSDRLGGLRLLDLRFPFPALRDFPASSTTTLASTGFVLDPMDQTLCFMLTPQGVLQTVDLDGRGRVSMAGTLVQAATTDTQWFLARRWQGTMPGTIWPPLLCGNRASGDVLRIDLCREVGS